MGKNKKIRGYFFTFFVILSSLGCILFADRISNHFFKDDYWKNKVQTLKKNVKYSKYRVLKKKIELQKEKGTCKYNIMQAKAQASTMGIDENLLIKEKKKQHNMIIQEKEDELKAYQQSLKKAEDQLKDAYSARSEKKFFKIL
jgi:hypothetical protein